jgi:hypothetical protein
MIKINVSETVRKTEGGGGRRREEEAVYDFNI